MAIYLKKAIFVNRAPFDNLELEFDEKSINVLTAINGKGKTTILSYIVDAFYELAKRHYANEFEGKEGKFYRVSSSMYNQDSSKPSFVYLRFSNGDKTADYIEIRNKFSESEYNSSIKIENKVPFGVLLQKTKKQDYLKYWHIDSDSFVSSVFENNLLTSFPSYRYELPSYLGDSYKVDVDYSKDNGFTGYLPNPIEVVTGMRQIANWIMDVVLDWELYKTTNNVDASQSRKDRVSVVSDNNGEITTVSPNLFCLSSGEKALLCCFGELLRQADKIHPNILLENVQGIVIIDEIDKHLHIKLQKEILPKLLNLFPNVQFIVSSHSPFLNMGLADASMERSQIIDLDNGGIVCTPTNNDLYQEVYELMIDENNRFANQLKDLEKELLDVQKPIIITEGKTDIKHILKAKEKLGLDDIDFGVIDEAKQPEGDANLESLLVQLGKVARPNKIIGVFDRDNDSIIKKVEVAEQKIRDFGNNVYAFCIPIPESRYNQGQKKISIEYLYSDDEIKTTLENGCRLFFGTEFTKHSMRHNSENLTLALPKGKGEDKVIENNGGQAVYDEDDNNRLAKKDDFAEAIKNEKIVINDESWRNFTPIFDTIRGIIQKE